MILLDDEGLHKFQSYLLTDMKRTLITYVSDHA